MLELNLLNPIERNKAKKIKLYFIIKQVAFQLTTLIIIITGVFYFSTILLDSNLNSINEQIDKEIQIRKDGNLNSIEEATKQLNTQLELVNNVQKKYFIWSNFLNNFNELVPTNIDLIETEFTTNILLNAQDKTFKIVGNAATRDDFSQFENNLIESGYFENINAPISNLIQKENINFTITGNITDEIFI